MQGFRFIPLIAFLFLTSIAGHAQWLNYPTAGIPRLPDGRPNLNAPAPRTMDGTVDLSGIWRTPTPDYLRDLTADGAKVQMRPWAEQLFKERIANDGRDRPTAACLPHSVTDFDAHFTPKKILQLPGLVVMLFESYRSYRQIHTDGRALPEEPREPSWLGYSVGRWEGETFVVQTVGINEKTWLDDAGHPHSDALQITERFQRRTLGRMDVEITIDDPKAYLAPWTVKFYWELLPDTELLDWVCENNKYFELIPKEPSRPKPTPYIGRTPVAASLPIPAIHSVQPCQGTGYASDAEWERRCLNRYGRFRRMRMI